MDPGASYVLRVLGTVDLRYADGRTARSVLANPKRVALLTYLTVEGRHGWVQRDTLLPLFWPESSEKHARTALRGAIHYLRRSMGKQAIEGTGPGIRIAPGLVDCDATRLLDAEEAGDSAAVLDLYAGPFLEGFNLSEAAGFETWQEGVRRRVHFMAVGAALSRAEAEEAAGASAAAVPYLRRALELEPADEDAFRRLLRALHGLGDRAGALSAYEDWSADLRRSLDLEPSPETIAEVERIRDSAATPDTGGPTAAAPAPTPAAAPADAPHAGAPHPPRPPPQPEPAPRFRLPWVIAGALAVAATLLLWPGSNGGMSAVGDAPAGVAVLPFDGTGNAPAYYAAALPYLVDPALEWISTVQAIDPAAVRDHLAASSPLEPAALARRLAAGRIVTGTVRVESGRATLEAVLRSAGERSEELGAARIEGRASELPALAAGLVMALMPDVSRASGSPPVPTADVRALEPFVEGEDHLRSGRYAAAEDAYARAVAIDSTFALAHYRRSTAADWLGAAALASASADHALVHSHRLGSRARRLLDAWRAELHGDVGAALQGYGRLAAAGPADVETWFRLGELRFHWGPLFAVTRAAADSAFAQVMRLSPDHAGAALHRLRLAGRRGDTGTFRSLAANLRARDPAPLVRLEMDLLEALANDRTPAPADLEHLGMLTAPQEWNVLAHLATSLEDPRPVLDLVSHLPPAAEPARTLERAWLRARILAGTGRYAEARRVVRQAGEEVPARTPELLAALALAGPAPPAPAAAVRLANALRETAGDPGEHRARDMAFDGIFEPRRVLAAALMERAADRRPLDALEAEINLVPGRFTDGYRRLLLARDASPRGEPAEAIRLLGSPAAEADHLRPGALSWPLALARWTRAEALLALGRDDDALRWYAGFPEPNGSDLMFLAPAHLRRAEVLERAGRRAAAAGAYALALELWQGADPEVRSLVGAARRGLARVTG